MANCKDSLLQDEISVLQSIYLPEELKVNFGEERPCEILATLHPYTADNEDEKYVCMQLVITIGDDYPLSKPSFDIRMPRGISDNQLDSILANLDGLASHKLGEEMLFTLIEYAKECLTNNNRPECPCSICLDVFEENDKFIRTECFHFFHDVCIARHVKSFAESIEKKRHHTPFGDQEDINYDMIPCPVCRTTLNRNSLKLDGVDTDNYTSEQMLFEPSEKFLAWRKRMEKVFLRQQKRGGIIDIEAEKNRFLIETKTKKERVSDEKTDEVREKAGDERRYVVGPVDDWVADDITSEDRQSQVFSSKSRPKDGHTASTECRGKGLLRTGPAVRSDRGRNIEWRLSSASRTRNDPGESYHSTRRNGTYRVNLERERQTTSAMRKANIRDAVVRETHQRVGEDCGTAEATISSKSPARKVISPPPGFKPIT